LKRSCCLLAGLILIRVFGAQSLSARSDTPSSTVVSPFASLASGPAKTRIVRNLGRLPLSFERNEGQADSHVRFLAHCTDGALFLTPSEAVFHLTPRTDTGYSAKNALRKGRSVRRPEGKTASVTVRMQMVGSDLRASVFQQQPLPGRVNYFSGKDPSRWHTGVPTFGRVGFHGVYPGVDLVYYGNQRHLEYDFVVAPHADPEQIQLNFAGAQGVHINPAGDLVVRVAGRELKWRKPTVYQQSATGKRSVAAHFRLKQLTNGRAGVSFALGRYDTARRLVIDPVLVYATYLGGSGSNGGDLATGIAIDSAGNAYVTGYAGSLDFPTDSGDYQRVHKAILTHANAFVTKLSPAGNTLVYSTYLGGSTADNANGIAVDSAGNAYITGRTFSTDFPTTHDAFQQVNRADHNAFVTKLNSTGSALVYSTYLGGSGSDSTVGIALDAGGHAFVTGHTVSSDFPTTAGAFQHVNGSSAGGNAFVTELNLDGTGLVYSTYLGGSSPQGDFGEGIAVDSAGSAYVTGGAFSPDFPTTEGAYQRVEKALDRSSAFITKLNATGSALVYSTYLGGSGNGVEGDVATSIAVDGGGQAYVTGNASSVDFPTTSGAFQRVNRAVLTHANVFVTKLDSTGSALVYSTYLGGSAGTYAYHLAVDGIGNAYVIGYTNATDFPTTAGAYQRTNAGATVGKANAFVTRLNAAGSALIYSTYLGGTGGDYGSAVAVDSAGDAYVVGYTGSADFPTTSDAVQATNSAIAVSASNAFVTKLFTGPLFPDFNGDGSTDLLLQNAASGVIAAWFMNGTHWLGGVYFSQSPPLDYALVGTGDFRGDGEIALVLQNRRTYQIALWYTGGADHAVITGGDYVNVTPQTGWKVVGVGDFNGDGRSDLVFQNQSTNQVALWFMSGPVYQGGVLLPFIPPIEWKIAGIGDINGDGSPDLICQNQATGQIALWYMNGTTYIGGAVMTTVPVSGWKVVGVGDYNGDGFADLLFQNQTSNQAAVWFLQNGEFVGGAALSQAPPPLWNIAGPR
jgi:hypothetical protein